MPKFVLIQVEDDTVSETTIVGVTDMVSIIVDWDWLAGDDVQAKELIEEIISQYPNRIDDAGVALVVERLNEIVKAVRDEEEEEEDYDEEEDLDAAHLLEHPEGGDEEEGELAFDDEDELDLNENFKQVD